MKFSLRANKLVRDLDSWEDSETTSFIRSSPKPTRESNFNLSSIHVARLLPLLICFVFVFLLVSSFLTGDSDSINSSPILENFDASSPSSLKKLSHILDTNGFVILNSKSCEASFRHMNKVAFIHINKAAGTSAVKMLNKHVDKNRFLKERTSRFMQHTVREYLNMTKSYHNWDDVFSFSIIRNPYDKMVSFLQYRARHCMSEGNFLNQKHGSEPDWKSCKVNWLLDENPGLSRIIHNHTYAIDFYRKWLRKWNALHSTHAFSGCAMNYREDASSLAWLLDEEGRVRVSAIVKLDGKVPFEDAWNKMAALCIPELKDVEMAHAKKCKQCKEMNYFEYYKGDPKAAEIVEQQMEQDLQFFGYPKRSWERDKT